MADAYRQGVINGTGVVTASRIGVNQDLNVSLNFNGGTATVKLERRPQRQDATNLYDYLLTLDGDRLCTLGGDPIAALGGSSTGGFRAAESFTADSESIAEVAGDTEFQLNCTAYTSGPIEYQLYN
jgi:hypothetical protein